MFSNVFLTIAKLPVQAGVFYEISWALCCLTFGPLLFDGNHLAKVRVFSVLKKFLVLNLRLYYTLRSVPVLARIISY